ncbi:MAG: hypothetical protein ABSF98_01820 [Bryobacteraceae bacterium]|jgi:hypothetical protein
MKLDKDDSATPRLPWLSMAATIVVAAALLVLFRPDLQKRLEAYTAPRADASPALRATPQGDSLQIAWPAGGRAFRNARAAALSIRDGDEWHRIALNQHALAAGQFLYRPSSSEVLVRLDVTDGADHPGVTETVRLLGLTPQREAPTAPAPLVEVAEEKAAAPPPEEQTADRAVAMSPQIVDRKMPAPLPQALRTIHGAIRVDVRVAIAANGKVQSAELLTLAQSPYFSGLSLAAAQKSRFHASTGGGSLVLHYEYTREGVQISQAAP